jgi:hypothetical protein
LPFEKVEAGHATLFVGPQVDCLQRLDSAGGANGVDH